MKPRLEVSQEVPKEIPEKPKGKFKLKLRNKQPARKKLMQLVSKKEIPIQQDVNPEKIEAPLEPLVKIVAEPPTEPEVRILIEPSNQEVVVSPRPEKDLVPPTINVSQTFEPDNVCQTCEPDNPNTLKEEKSEVNLEASDHTPSLKFLVALQKMTKVQLDKRRKSVSIFPSDVFESVQKSAPKPDCPVSSEKSCGDSFTYTKAPTRQVSTKCTL